MWLFQDSVLSMVTRCFLEYLTVNLVCSLDDLPFIGDSDVLTLVRVKVHLPVPLPLLKVVKIFL